MLTDDGDGDNTATFNMASDRNTLGNLTIPNPTASPKKVQFRSNGANVAV